MKKLIEQALAFPATGHSGDRVGIHGICDQGRYRIVQVNTAQDGNRLTGCTAAGRVIQNRSK